MKKICLIFCVMLFFCSCGDVSVSTKKDNVKPYQHYETLSSNKQGWGFRRTENGPEFSEVQIRHMEEYDCIYKESTQDKSIYLTFDEGYENGYTSVILDTLRKKDVNAAFFVTGPYVKENPELIKRMAQEGHTIGNHTVNHPSIPEIDNLEKLKTELFELDRLVYGITGTKVTFLRPPKGEYSERSLAITHDMGYTNVFWSQAYVDWNDNVTASEAFEKVTSDLHPGCVLLLHAVSRGNAEALENIIDYARKEGYTFKVLSQYKK